MYEERHLALQRGIMWQNLWSFVELNLLNTRPLTQLLSSALVPRTKRATFDPGLAIWCTNEKFIQRHSPVHIQLRNAAIPHKIPPAIAPIAEVLT